MNALAHLVVVLALGAPAEGSGEVRAWEGKETIPTYPWEEDIHPKFWALEGGAKLSTTVHGAITYPYVMQDHLSRTKVDRTYRALYLENEYLKVICLPELGGRLHSVLDKTSGEEMFYRNQVIKPGMIAMRGAWISGGVEWNTGPHGHTVTAVSPVNAAVGTMDGSAWLEISNTEQIFRTRWTVRVTLRRGRAALDEEIRIENPTDGMHPYYFWNCTAFPNRPGTRFIYPMTLGTDHNAREFFRWPIDKGRDLTWLKNYPTYASVFSVDCTYDFFGAYDVDADRGIVQVADHRELGGKKAWTWGEWEFGRVAQNNLTDEDGPYIEVQSGPLPTQSDYGMLGPHEHVSWKECWYPVHGLGDGFEYATKDLAVQTARREGRLELRLLATEQFPKAVCVLSREGRELVRQDLDLSPMTPAVVTLTDEPEKPVDIRIQSEDGAVLAAFTSPLPIPVVEPPDPSRFVERPDEELTVEELYLKGRKADRGTERRRAREYYEKALAKDPGHVDSLRALAVLDFEAGLYADAIRRVDKALERDSDDGLCWYYRGVSQLRLGNLDEAVRCGYRAARCTGTITLGYDLAGRARARMGYRGKFSDAKFVYREAFRRESRSMLGDPDFELLEEALGFANVGLMADAALIVKAACVDAVPPVERSPLPLYYLAWYSAQSGDEAAAKEWLVRAAATHKAGVFASRPEEIEILQYATKSNPQDAQAHYQLGCLFANLGRVEEATAAWQEAVRVDPAHSGAWRNLGLAAASRNDLARAEQCYRKAIEANPVDQTLYRDLAEILLAGERRPEAVALLEAMPFQGVRRAEITVMLADAYVAEERWADCIRLLEETPYFVNWEGQDVTWRLFNRAHIARGRQLLEKGDPAAALADFEAALTYPANLNVGRPDKPEEAPAQYWRGRALAALGRHDDARAAWRAGASGPDLPGPQTEYRAKCREALQ